LNEEGKGNDELRHRCLVRWVIKKRLQDRDGAYRWLNGYRDNMGQYKKGWNELHPKSILEADVRDQWTKGNRGNEGEWK
jgi:hypothetical protein